MRCIDKSTGLIKIMAVVAVETVIVIVEVVAEITVIVACYRPII